MSKSCDACAKRVNEVRNFYGANVCRKCATDLKEAYGGPETLRSPHRGSGPSGINMDQAFGGFHGEEPSPESMDDIFGDPEACPGCGSKPGDGITYGCDDPMGCGHNRANQDAAIGDAVADTQRSPRMSHMKHESAKFDGDAYMEETIRLEEARKRQNKAPVTQDSIGHIRQLRTQELPQNRIRIGK